MRADLIKPEFFFMLITLQFPLFDARYLRLELIRIERPDWTGPAPKDRVRYMGEIIESNGTYRGPWDGEKKYCSAHKVIDFCGNGDNHFFTQFYKQSKILYRRVQSDGDSLVQFQIGFYDNVDEQNQPDHKTLEKRIRQYLALKVKIRIGNKLSDYIPLAQCGQYLKEAYYWSTTKGRKTFNTHEFKYQVEEGDPLIMVEYRLDQLQIPESDYTSVVDKSIKKSGLKLQFGTFDFKPSGRSIPAWLIGHQRDQAMVISDFNKISLSLKHLRISMKPIDPNSKLKEL